MKTSVILIVLIFVNTSALIAEPIAQALSGVSNWILYIVEGILVVGYYINNFIKEIRKVSEIDLNNLKLFSTKNKRSA